MNVNRSSSGGEVSPYIFPPRQTTVPSARKPHTWDPPLDTNTNGGMGVGVNVGVNVGVGVQVGVGVKVGVGVRVFVGVGVNVGVNVTVGVGVMVGVSVGVGVCVIVGVRVIVGVIDGVGVVDGVGVMDGVKVGVGVPRAMTCLFSLRSNSMTDTANPILSTGLPLAAVSILEVFTPMTAPSILTSGPPLLPGLIAASVWKRSTPDTSLVEEMMPRVTVRLLPILSASGNPSASTSSPTRALSGSPIAM